MRRSRARGSRRRAPSSRSRHGEGRRHDDPSPTGFEPVLPPCGRGAQDRCRNEPAMNADVAFRENRRLLWGIGYRMTGSAQDADDIVQEAFARAIDRPPKEGWRPWLVK